jgi:hypothetical protein
MAGVGARTLDLAVSGADVYALGSAFTATCLAIVEGVIDAGGFAADTGRQVHPGFWENGVWRELPSLSENPSEVCSIAVAD